MKMFIIFFYTVVRTYTVASNMKIKPVDVIITPANSLNEFVSLKFNTEYDYKIEMKKLGDLSTISSKEASKFVKENNCLGYSLYLSKRKVCFDKETEKLKLCVAEKEKFMIWDVVKRSGGVSICTADPYRYGLFDYNYEYCITRFNSSNPGNETLLTMAQYAEGDQNQLFDIYDAEKKIKIEDSSSEKEKN